MSLFKEAPDIQIWDETVLHLYGICDAWHRLGDEGIAKASIAELPVLVAPPCKHPATEADRGAEVLACSNADNALRPQRLHQRRPRPVVHVPMPCSKRKASAESVAACKSEKERGRLHLPWDWVGTVESVPALS